jgi:hypothetical protein
MPVTNGKLLPWDRQKRRAEREAARRRETTEIVLGTRWPRTPHGWWFYLRYWSPLAEFARGWRWRRR